MSNFFLDSSALVKRYLTEIGSKWIRGLTSPEDQHTVAVAEITLVEVAAALAARQRAPKGISLSEREAAINLLARHFAVEYQIIPISRYILDQAVILTQNYRLRGYDAVQLAAALAANQTFLVAGFPALTFVAADDNLLTAARQENLQAENPNAHSL